MESDCISDSREIKVVSKLRPKEKMCVRSYSSLDTLPFLGSCPCIFFGLEFVNSVLISSVARKALNQSPLHFTKFRSACLLALPPALRGNHFIPPTSGNFIINYFQFYFSIIFFVQQEWVRRVCKWALLFTNNQVDFLRQNSKKNIWLENRQYTTFT